ncbi:hypothetical protein [Sphingobacterium deserti]|uniref:Carboxypeptidase-like regulatory domain-containing protein n=1 Tax=Sphingobacterium deserti TaxID=1229276 RepID=A0A0B8T9Z2_9SPHI|nr:hypothetical protein [Sphingobacterium deserti]KGE15594.1 hypothetical protein DI53_0698 [Sphingobacterium deserti]
MKNYLIFLLFLILGKTPAFAQVLFIDQNTKNPITALNLYNKDGELIGFTDNQGKYTSTLERQSAPAFPLTINTQHLSYESKSIVLQNLSEPQTIEIVPRSVAMDAVEVDSKPADVIILTGYYRSLETFDSNTKYFSDGIVEFYLPRNGKKVRYKLLDYRIFRDSIVQKDFDTKMGSYFKVARLPNLSGHKLIDRLKRFDINKSNPNKLIIEKDNKETGQILISEKDQTSRFHVDFVLPDTAKSQKIFSLEAKTKSEVYLENYASSNFNELSPYYLTSLYEHAIGSIKRKTEFGHIPYEDVIQFYVMERSGISAREYKSRSSKLESNLYKTEKKSQYSYKFWEDLERYAIPEINNALKSKLGTTMQLIE